MPPRPADHLTAFDSAGSTTANRRGPIGCVGRPAPRALSGAAP